MYAVNTDDAISNYIPNNNFIGTAGNTCDMEIDLAGNDVPFPHMSKSLYIIEVKHDNWESECYIEAIMSLKDYRFYYQVNAMWDASQRISFTSYDDAVIYASELCHSL